MRIREIHGVKKALLTAYLLSALSVLLYGVLIALYFLYRWPLLIAILVLSGIVMVLGIGDLFRLATARYRKYEGMTGRFLEAKLYDADPDTGERFERLTAVYETDGKQIKKPIVGFLSVPFAKSHSKGAPVKIWLAQNGDPVLLQEQSPIDK
jgi:hypothetical protein